MSFLIAIFPIWPSTFDSKSLVFDVLEVPRSLDIVFYHNLAFD